MSKLKGIRLYGSSGDQAVYQFCIPGEPSWIRQMFVELERRVPGSHDLLIVLLNVQKCREMRGLGSEAVFRLLKDAEEEFNAGDRNFLLRTFYIGFLTELKILFDRLNTMRVDERDKVLDGMRPYYRPTSSYMETSFDELERILLMGNQNIESYWSAVKRDL